MRKLAWAAIGFAAASFLAEYLLPVSGLPWFAAALAVLCVPALLLKGNSRKKALICLFAAVCGCLGWKCHYDRRVAPCEALAGQTVALSAEVIDYPSEGETYTKVEMRVRSGAPTEKAAIYFENGEGAGSLRPGDVVTVTVRLSSVLSIGDDPSHSKTAENINLVGFAQGSPQVTGRASGVWRYFPKRIAQTVKNTCDALFSEETAGFMKGLLTGDTTQLQAQTETYGNMKAAGVLHIVAVSGMHLFVLTAFLQLLFGQSKAMSLVILPFLWLFVLMAGCPASVVRAAVMQTLLLLAPVLERESDGITSVMAALLLILVKNPMAIGGIGLQLSFLCALGYGVVLPNLPFRRRIHTGIRGKLISFAGDNLRCSVAAQSLSLPVSAWYFGTVPILSPLANLLTVPVVEICFGGGYLACAAALVLPGAGKILAWVVELFVRWCLLVYRIMADIPWSCLYTESPWVLLWVVWLYAVFGLWMLLWKKNVRFRWTVPAMLSVMGVCAVVLLSVKGVSEGATVTALDVGQGACAVLTDETATVVVDCGGKGLPGAGQKAADYIASCGRNKIELLILTHLHDDHTNGLEELFARLPVETLILPAEADDGDESLSEILSLAEEYGTEVIRLEQPTRATLGDMELNLYLPSADTDVNERGIVVEADIYGRKTLIMGDGGDDAELALLAAGQLEDVDILIAGHHGSKTASTALFLRAVEAETAIVSVGYNNYGLPAEETMERLNEYCETVLRTDEAGTVTVHIKDERVTYG